MSKFDNFCWLRFNLYCCCLCVWSAVLGFILEAVFGSNPDWPTLVAVLIGHGGLCIILSETLCRLGWFKKP